MQTRKRPAGNRPSPKSRDADYHQSSGDNRHSTLTAAERHEKKLLDEIHELGYSVSLPCLVCSHPLTSPRSLALHVGPKCLAKLADAEAVR